MYKAFHCVYFDCFYSRVSLPWVTRYNIDFFIQTKEKIRENRRLGTDVSLSTTSVVIIVMQGSAETRISNVILTI